MDARSEIVLRDRDVQLDAEYLNGLNEAERGILKFSLSSRDKVVSTLEQEIRVLARDEWGGLNSGGELLAAFVMPNDPAIAMILKTASEVLANHGHNSALDGYQSHDPGRAYLLLAAIWSAVASRSLTYANPPRSFELVGQKTRRPATVFSDGLATCLDSTLLFAAAIEAVGLNPVIVMVEGHSLVGAWLVEKTLGQVIEKDCSEIRKAIAAKELITFETTLVTGRQPTLFEEAVKTAGSSTVEAREAEFLATIDIRRARMAQILPLASHLPASQSVDDPNVERGPLPLPAVPDIGDVAPQDSDEKPSTPQGRIDRWQRKLLDLSLRNRLLNFKLNKQSIPILCPDISKLEDRLAVGAKLRLISLQQQNPLGERDAETHRQRTNQDLDFEFAKSALDRDEISCTLNEQELSERLTTIYRNVRNDLSEGGSNTLYLAVGFLRWKPKLETAKSYRAPLLLVPVKLTRKSALSSFQLSLHEDDVRFNSTLIQMLKKDFDRDLTYLESDLPRDENGYDVSRILDKIRREVREISGFEVVDESVLGTFSFSKYLMWKDLVDRIEMLKQNRVVRHLIDNPEKSFESVCGSIPNPQQIDIRFEPKDIYCPLPADSSQLAAIMAASEGQDFVLVGPPGTGKSQTIANVISQCLAVGKTVLFVAEKTAALDVVYRRLKEHGLGDCCIELHSNKAERRKFLDQLDSAWQNNRQTSQNDWLTISERLKIRRDELNAYVTSIHRPYPNGWSAFQAMGICVKGGDQPTPALKWHNTVQHDREAYQNLEKLVGSLGLAYRVIDRRSILPMVKRSQWSATWEQSLLAQCRNLKIAAEAFRSGLQMFSKAIGIGPRTDCSLPEFDGLKRLAKSLVDSANEDVQILFHKQFAKFDAAKSQLSLAIKAHQAAVQSLSADYVNSLDSLPLDEIEHRWRKAVSMYFPLSWFAKRSVTRTLQTFASSGVANPATDISAIRSVREQLANLSANPLAGQTSHWNAAETSTAKVEIQLAKASELRNSIIAVGKQFDSMADISKAVHPFINGKNPQATVFVAAAQFLKATQRFSICIKGLSELSVGIPLEKDSREIIQTSIAVAHQIETGRSNLQRWTSWVQVRSAALKTGLDDFVAKLELGEIEASNLLDRFRLAYARWWIPGIIDRDDVLRSFQRYKHEDAIADFRQLDESARAAVSLRAKQRIAHDLPLEGNPRNSELGFLNHQIRLSRPSKSIREVISSIPGIFGKLAPCLLMSPLSIAQYLPADQALFDVVLFDEASQITTWDAVGAIARGRQTIIVGDPKQLPPTNFFGRTDDDETNDEIEDHEKDLESILDEAKASGLPTLQLNWHYRSRHESLIAFSNWNYYGNNLITFPAAESDGRGVTFVHLPTANYDRGKSRTNRKEAQAIVDEAVARMKCNLQLPEHQRLTFGVITFNSQQQSLIQDLFDQAQRDCPELDWYFADERIEPTVVKNLENVQGDERDVMLFSITFGRDISGKSIPLTFGALNRDGGERRLNVAITRARQELMVFSSFKAEDLQVERSKSRGVADLKAFLEYAEKGPEAIAMRIAGSVGGFDSPFEEAVATALESKGWQVVPQVGVSGFRVDLGIRHPDKPGAYLAGVECDGATYHRSAVARDRDKIRQMVLENLGWNILRVWSPDWWYDAKSATETLDGQLCELIEETRSTNLAEIKESSIRIEENLVQDAQMQIAPSAAIPEAKVLYVRVKLADVVSNQNRFFDSSYNDELRQMAFDVLQCESPIRDDILVRQVARAHGFARSGANIRSRILDLLGDVVSTVESTGRFLWASDEPQQVVEFRHAKASEDRRSVEEISIAELIGLIKQSPELLAKADPAMAVARDIGLSRLSQSARKRIEEAVLVSTKTSSTQNDA
jgi:very-short-patch-repair endonuclease